MFGSAVFHSLNGEIGIMTAWDQKPKALTFIRSLAAFHDLIMLFFRNIV
jgi:hypothetical protein